MVSKVVPGFKNSKANGGEKIHNLFPNSFEALKSLYYIGAKGLIFCHDDGSCFEYKQIAGAYDRAFKNAGLPYTATHILRHGGTQRAYNENRDLDLAGQLLGNNDRSTIEVYAKRRKHQLTKMVGEHWDRHESKTPSDTTSLDFAGRNWSHSEGAL
ncbi:MAG: hypothetical protein NTV34_16640 [Proteobacteria bacterium]|nr:hypothetical protein [Pseudomonadota bacterium]